MNSNASAFSAELTAVMIMRSEGDTTGFLISLASCFLNRVTQIWNRRKDQELSSLTLQKPEALIMPAREREGKEHADTFVGGTFDDDSDKESDSSATNADIIDPMAYRIPCPRSSGGESESEIPTRELVYSATKLLNLRVS